MSLVPISARDVAAFQRRLLSWYARSKRDLPWRRTKDPYRVWLSEVMLQQTRVAAVVPYYERFLAHFPNVRALARAKSDRVLSQWAGLGYYSRARNLQSAAKEIVANHAGKFPRSFEVAISLPGVGRYTAAAVLSIAYGEPRAVLDGNVARVLARMAAVHGDLRTPAVWRKLEAASRDLLSQDAPGDWNQAMMELGATVCTPKGPRCGDCPAARWCRARKMGISDELPTARKKRSPVEITLSAAVLLDPRGRTLLVRQANEAGALFSRMWQFPELQMTAAYPKNVTGAGSTWSPGKIVQKLRQKFGVTGALSVTSLEPARHTVTFRNIRLEPYLVRVQRLPRLAGARIVKLGQIRSLPISNATKKIAAAAAASGGEARQDFP